MTSFECCFLFFLFFLRHRLLHLWMFASHRAPIGLAGKSILRRLRWHFPPRPTRCALLDVVYVSACAFFFFFFFFNQTQTLCIFIPNLSLQSRGKRRPSCPAIKDRQPKPGPSVVPLSFSLSLNDRGKKHSDGLRNKRKRRCR